MIYRSYLFFGVLLMVAICCQEKNHGALHSQKKSLADEMALSLEHDLFDIWYPLALDSIYGGFLSDFNEAWKPEGPQDKMIVTQARHLWTCSKAAAFYPEDTAYRSYALHGFEFLKDVMWDREYGGFYNLKDRQGLVKTGGEGIIMKNAYGNAFAIYGLAAYYRLSKDEEALNLARKAFYWLDEHSYDKLHGGYFQFLQQDGTPLTTGNDQTPPKDPNSTIHLLEAFTELYHVWPNDTLRNRLQALFSLVRDTITTEKGYMNLFFQRDWTPISYRDSTANVRAENYHLDHISFGHDVETAFLLLEAAETLNMGNDPETGKIAKTMVDHALTNGWDDNRGGLFDGGYYYEKNGSLSIIKDTKVWWAQAEMLNTLLMMASLFPNDERAYFDMFKTQWGYIQTHLIDPEHRGWYWSGTDTAPEKKAGPKGTIWKGNYHTARSLMRCISMLEEDI